MITASRCHVFAATSLAAHSLRPNALTNRFASAKLFVMVFPETRDAARMLGVSVRQVQNLVTRGELTSPSRGIIDATSIERFLAQRGQHRSRPWSMPTAWGAVAILSGVPASWMGTSQRSRLKARLRETTAEELLAGARARAETLTFAGHPSAVARVRAVIVDTGDTATRLGLAPSANVNGYLASNALEELTRQFALVRDDAGSFTLRTTEFPIETIRDLADVDVVLAALDLAESLDIRERRAGLDTLARALEKLRD